MPKVFMCGTSFRASYGGPAISVPRLARALADRGVSVVLWAPDGSASSLSAEEPGSGIEYLGGTLQDALSRGGRPDIIHDNGIWLPHNHALARAAGSLGIARIVAPRGMLEPWSLSHRAIKKRAAWFLYQKRDLDAADLLHCTAEGEAESVKRLDLDVEHAIVPNGVDLPPEDGSNFSSVIEFKSSPDRLRSRRMLFLGRVHPKKGLPMLLVAWSGLAPVGWELLIAGPSEGGHDKEVMQLVDHLGLARVVRYIGPVYGQEKQALLRSADVFVLPTHSENFGMAIAEALATGRPVLTTTAAPWEIIREEDCGWWVEPTLSGIRQGLVAAISASDTDRVAMGARGRRMMKERFSWEIVGAEMEGVYRRVLSARAVR